MRSPLSTLPARIIVPAFPQRSPPRLLTAAACGGLGSAPDCRTRRAFLHLRYSCVKPCGPAFTRDTRPNSDLPQRYYASTRSSANASCETRRRRGGADRRRAIDERSTREMPCFVTALQAHEGVAVRAFEFAILIAAHRRSSWRDLAGGRFSRTGLDRSSRPHEGWQGASHPPQRAGDCHH